LNSSDIKEWGDKKRGKEKTRFFRCLERLKTSRRIPRNEILSVGRERVAQKDIDLCFEEGSREAERG